MLELDAGGTRCWNWTLDAGAGRSTLELDTGAGRWTLDAGSWIPRYLDTWILDMPGAGDAGYCFIVV